MLKRSWASQMNCCRISLERACFVLSIINAVVISTCFAGIIYFFHLELCKGIADLNRLFEIILSGIALVYVGLSFIFSMLFCYGVHQRKPAYLRAFVVFAIMSEFIFLMGLMVHMVKSYPNFKANQVMIYVIILVITVVYGCLLILVQRTRRVWITCDHQSAHTKLVEDNLL